VIFIHHYHDNFWLITLIYSFVIPLPVSGSNGARALRTFDVKSYVLIRPHPFLMPVISIYYTIVQYATFAQAYKDGKDRLSLEVAEG